MAWLQQASQRQHGRDNLLPRQEVPQLPKIAPEYVDVCETQQKQAEGCLILQHVCHDRLQRHGQGHQGLQVCPHAQLCHEALYWRWADSFTWWLGGRGMDLEHIGCCLLLSASGRWRGCKLGKRRLCRTGTRNGGPIIGRCSAWSESGINARAGWCRPRIYAMGSS